MVTEVTHTSWGGRLMESIKGVLFGIILFLGSFVLLWWNESRAVRVYQNLNEVRDAAVSVAAATISSAHEGKPVHVTGEARTDEVLADPEFDVSATAIRFRREVEMYQWEERSETRTRKKLGGGEERVTEYTYHKVWSDRLISSSGFKESGPHQNPSTMPYEDLQLTADTVTLGSFTLAPPVIRKMNFFQPLTPRIPSPPAGARMEGRYLMFGSGGGAPEIGDVRVSFSTVPTGTVSVIGGQSGDELAEWRTSNGNLYSRVQQGAHSLEAMMDQAESEARLLTWILRGAGWLAMAIGISMVLRPLSVMGDVIPFVGNLVGGGIALVAGLVSGVLSLTTIAIAWITVRPMIGVPLLVIAAVLLFLQWKKGRQDKKLAQADGPPVPPPPPPPGA